MGWAALRRVVSAELAAAEGSFAGHGPITPHLVVRLAFQGKPETT